ncbi:MAG: hypothetical protein JWQ35_2337 [Bacteriovoracaceae bacterium]|nr:hypothetical protein [Bacteriovoracaceae bacterium]
MFATFILGTALSGLNYQPVFADEPKEDSGGTAFDKLSDEWSKSFIFENGVYTDIFMGLQMIGDAYLMNQYDEVSHDKVFKNKIKKLQDDGFAKIAVYKDKAVPYIISDLISNASMHRDSSLKYKKLGWNVPIILLRATEARDQAIKDALLTLNKNDVLKELQILQNKIGKEEELGELLMTVRAFTKSVEEANKSQKK